MGPQGEGHFIHTNTLNVDIWCDTRHSFGLLKKSCPSWKGLLPASMSKAIGHGMRLQYRGHQGLGWGTHLKGLRRGDRQGWDHCTDKNGWSSGQKVTSKKEEGRQQRQRARDSSLKNRTVITSARFNCKGWPKSGTLFWGGRKRTIVTPLALCQKIQLIGSPQRLMWNQATTQCEQCFPIVSIYRSQQQHTVRPNSKIPPKVKRTKKSWNWLIILITATVWQILNLKHKYMQSPETEMMIICCSKENREITWSELIFGGF